MPDFIVPYQSAVLALTVLTLIVLLQSFLGAVFGFVKGSETPGAALQGSHGDLGFRALRTYQNSVENLPAFAIAIFAAILAGASASLVGLLAWLHVGIRVLFWAIYYAGISKPAGGIRSITYVAGWAVNIAIVIVALLALV